jgi:hypothetical protein
MAIKEGKSLYSVQLRSGKEETSKDWYSPIEALKVSFAFAQGFAMAAKMLSPRPAIKIIEVKTLQEILFIPGEVVPPDRDSFRGSRVLQEILARAPKIGGL